jgi:small basic protein
MEVKRHYLISDILHVRSFFEIVLNGLLSFIGAVLGYFHLLVISESKIFIAVGIIVGIDWLAGMWNAYVNNKFETNKFSIVLDRSIETEKTFIDLGFKLIKINNPKLFTYRKIKVYNCGSLVLER